MGPAAGRGRILWFRRSNFPEGLYWPGYAVRYFNKLGFMLPGPSGAQYVDRRCVHARLRAGWHRAILVSCLNDSSRISDRNITLAIFQPWLAPTQAAILNITAIIRRLFAPKVEKSLNEKGYRANCGL